MRKYFLVSSAAVMISVCSVAQTSRERIERALKDPKAAENAAKADVLLIDKTKISDSIQFQTDTTVAIPPAKKKKRARYQK